MLNGGQTDVQWQRRLKFGPSKTCLKCNSIFVYEIIFPIEIDHQSKQSNCDGAMRVRRVSKWSSVTKCWKGTQYSDKTVWPPQKIKDGWEGRNLSGPLKQLMRSRRLHNMMRLQASAAKCLRTAPFWVIAQKGVNNCQWNSPTDTATACLNSCHVGTNASVCWYYVETCWAA